MTFNVMTPPGWQPCCQSVYDASPCQNKEGPLPFSHVHPHTHHINMKNIRCFAVLFIALSATTVSASTQTIRGVAITSDSVDSSTDYSQVQAVL
ncbi:hypothetical protein ACHAXM_006470, partial [Skeletonema potamos]